MIVENQSDSRCWRVARLRAALWHTAMLTPPSTVGPIAQSGRIKPNQAILWAMTIVLEEIQQLHSPVTGGVPEARFTPEFRAIQGISRGRAQGPNARKMGNFYRRNRKERRDLSPPSPRPPVQFFVFHRWPNHSIRANQTQSSHLADRAAGLAGESNDRARRKPVACRKSDSPPNSGQFKAFQGVSRKAPGQTHLKIGVTSGTKWRWYFFWMCINRWGCQSIRS